MSTTTLTLILFLIFFGMLSLVLWSMWMRGEISGIAPRTHRERLRLYWLIVGAVNFIAFLAHAGFDGGCFAFPAGGRLVDGLYHVIQHGRDFTLTSGRYFFSYWHGVLFMIIHIACMVAYWRLKKEPV